MRLICSDSISLTKVCPIPFPPPLIPWVLFYSFPITLSLEKVLFNSSTHFFQFRFLKVSELTNYLFQTSSLLFKRNFHVILRSFLFGLSLLFFIWHDFQTFSSLDTFQGLPLVSKHMVRKEGNLPSSRCSLAKAETARLYCLLGSEHPLLWL